MNNERKEIEAYDVANDTKETAKRKRRSQRLSQRQREGGR